MTSYFYEDDEPVEKIEQAFRDGERGLTAKQDLLIVKGNVIRRVKAGDPLGVSLSDGEPVTITGCQIVAETGKHS